MLNRHFDSAQYAKYGRQAVFLCLYGVLSAGKEDLAGAKPWVCLRVGFCAVGSVDMAVQNLNLPRSLDTLDLAKVSKKHVPRIPLPVWLP
jgi:hypothetical protein